MPSLRSLAFATTLALGLVLAHRGAAADAAGDKALAAVDAALNKYQTLSLGLAVATVEPGKPERKVTLDLKLKGEKRFAELTAPGDVKGTKLLVLAADQIYAYLPAFGKVRRIAAHTSDQGFLGMAFTVADLARVRWSVTYGATVGGDRALTLLPKAGVTATWAKVEMVLAKEKDLPIEVKHYDAAGKLVRTATFTGYTCEGAVCTPATIKVVDHAKGISSTATRTTIKVNAPIADDVFSKRNLEK